MDIPVDYVEIDPNFEPLSRVRSNTWPLRPVEISPDPQNSPGSDETTHADHTLKEIVGIGKSSKSASRRNAWGNLSYADLITNAIKSSPEQRLTLSQIYDWMVHNVPFFRDKGESNSSAGWKNSIRHNLSLHMRFMRMPNEGGAGKSSWWVINPEAKPGKTQRSRRANSMETKTMEKKRHRARKRVEALRAMEGSGSPTRGDERYLLSPIDPGPFRDRTSSNASTLSGRLSPILAFEKDVDDELGSWGSNSNIPGAYMSNSETIPDNLVDSLMDSMRLVDGNMGLAATPEESMITDNVDQVYMSAGNSGVLYGYTQGSPALNDMSSHPSPLYRETQNISPAQLNEMSQHSPQGVAYPMAMVQQQQQPGLYQAQNRSAGDSVIMDDMMMTGLNPSLSVQKLSPCGSPQRGSYLGNLPPYHTSTQSPQAKQLSPNASLSPVSSPQMSPQQQQHQQQQQLSPQEVRKLILNSCSNPLLQKHLQQVPAASSANSRLLQALTSRTNAQLTQSQIKQLKLLSSRKLDTDRRLTLNTLQTQYNQPHQANLGGMNASPNRMMSQSPSLNHLLNSPSHPPIPASLPAVSHPNQQIPASGGNNSLLAQFSFNPTNNSSFVGIDVPTASLPTGGVPTAGSLNDIDVDCLQGVDCDVDRVLDYELSLGGDLDFNFDPNEAKRNFVH